MKWGEFKWLVENFGNILLMVLSTLFVLGSGIELIARLIPTEKPDSALTRLGLKMGRFGTSLVKAGNGVKVLLDLVGFPNRKK